MVKNKEGDDVKVLYEVWENSVEISKEDIETWCTLFLDDVYNVLLTTFSTEHEAVEYLKSNYPYSSISKVDKKTYQIKEYMVVKAVYIEDGFGELKPTYESGDGNGIEVSKIVVFNTDNELLGIFDSYVEALQFKEGYCYNEETKALEEDDYVAKRAYVY